MNSTLFGTILMEVLIVIIGVIAGYGIFKIARPFTKEKW